MENEKINVSESVTDTKEAEGNVISQGEVALSKQETEASVADRTSDATELRDESVSGTDGGEEASADSRLEMKKEFERLIKGDYKEFYEERVKENLNRRFRESAQKRQKNAQNDRIAQMLYERYNIADGDAESLINAIESDNAYLAAEAGKRGMSIEDYKYIRHLERENRTFHERQAEYEAAEKANLAVKHWYDESQSLKESYPEFDIFAEAKNPSFVSLLKSGIDIKTAYEVVHHSELVSRAADAAAKEAERKTADAIRQRAQRPAENGISSSSSAIITNSVSSLSAKEREEIAKRAARGERITF